MLVKIVPCSILVVISFAHVPFQFNDAQRRFEVDRWTGVRRHPLKRTELERARFEHDIISETFHQYKQLSNNTHLKPYGQSVGDNNSKLNNATTTTTVSYFVDSQSSTEETVDNLEENSTDNKHNGFYNVTTTTTLSHFPNSQSSSEGTDDNTKMQEKKSTEKRDIYDVTTKTTVSYFVDSQSSTKGMVDDHVRVQNSTTKIHDFGNVTSVAFVSTVTPVSDADNIANDNKTNIARKDTWIKRRGIFILIPAVLVVTAGVIALLILKRVNIVACFNKRGNYDVQGGFLRLNTCERSQYDSVEHVHFIPHQ